MGPMRGMRWSPKLKAWPDRCKSRQIGPLDRARYLCFMHTTGHTITKKALLKSVKELPDQVSVEDLMDRVLLLSKIERGMEQSAKGEV